MIIFTFYVAHLVNKSMVSAIISSIVNARSFNCIAEANHVVNFSPAVFTDPTIVWVDSCGYDIVIAIQRRSLIFALEVGGTHHSRCTNWVG